MECPLLAESGHWTHPRVRPALGDRFRPKADTHGFRISFHDTLKLGTWMRRILPLLLLATIGCFGCSTDGRPSNSRAGAFEAASKRYQELAAAPVPASWRPGASWAFVALDKTGAVSESFVFRVTTIPQKACLSGEWMKLELVSGDATQLSEPAYAIEGRNLQILLSTALCDAYPMYTGEVSEKGFAGSHNFSHLMGGEEYGKAYGVPVDVPR